MGVHCIHRPQPNNCSRSPTIRPKPIQVSAVRTQLGKTNRGLTNDLRRPTSLDERRAANIGNNESTFRTFQLPTKRIGGRRSKSGRSKKTFNTAKLASAPWLNLSARGDFHPEPTERAEPVLVTVRVRSTVRPLRNDGLSKEVHSMHTPDAPGLGKQNGVYHHP